MNVNGIRKRLLALENSQFGPEGMKERGESRGKIGEPIKSHEELDSVEIQSEQSYKRLHEDTVAAYSDAIQAERTKIDPRLLGQDPTNAETNSPENHRASAEAENRFSDILEGHRTDLTAFGGKAKDASGNLNQFRSKHRNQLEERAPEYPENRKKVSIMIGVIVLGISTAMCALLYPQDDSSTFVDILGAVLLVVVINSVIGITLAESWRAKRHQFHAFRVGSVFILIVGGIVSILLNLGNGHYRDALDPDFPAHGPDTTGIEIPRPDTTSNEASAEIVPHDNCTRISTSRNGGTNVEDQPSSEALCLLISRPFRFNELHSVIYAILGGILLLSIAWLWWINDDEYFLYGSKARRHARRLSEWHKIRDDVVRLLQAQRDQSIRKIEESHIDLIANREESIRSCNDHLATIIKLLQEIKEDCESSILSYRTANIEARPRLIKYPPHWDKRWSPSWVNLPSEPLADLCSLEEARKLAQHEDEIINAEIATVEARYQDYLRQVSNFGPQTEQELMHLSISNETSDSIDPSST